MKARRTWSKATSVLKDYGCQPKLLYPAKMSIIVEGERKIFHDINKMIEYMPRKPTHEKILEAIQRTEEGSNYPQALERETNKNISAEVETETKIANG